MFGLEKQKRNAKPEEFVFDLEKELKIPQRQKEIKAKIESRLQSIKEVLRSGENQEDFDRFGILLHGYNALLKVMSRFTAKK